MESLVLSTAAVCLMLAANTKANAATEAIVHANNQTSFQLLAKQVDYAETGNGILGTNTGLLNTETGWIGGGEISSALMNPDTYTYFRASFSLASGRTHYIGAPIGGGAYGSLTDNHPATIADYSLQIGKGFALGSDCMLTPFAEAGYHYWYRGINYGETYHHAYYGGGAMFQASLGKGMVVGLSAMIGRTSRAYINVAGPKGFSGDLGSSTIYRIGVAADYALSPTLHLETGADYTSFKYGISNLFPFPGGYTWEPDSRTNHITLKAGIGITF